MNDTVDAMLDNLEQYQKETADETCSNQWCDDPAPYTWMEHDLSNGFPVCVDCREILRGNAP